jgi:RecA/RadA recombinase
MASNANKLLNELKKKTGAVSFKDSKWAKAPHYISTGDYGVNQIISGSIYKGIPAGRVTVFAGESQSLKTVQVVRIAANALNELNYDLVFYFDSEGGAPIGMFENFGCDPEKIQHVLVESTEDATIKMIKTLKTIEEIQKEDPEFKAVVILDSLGNLENDKTYNDIDNDRLAADQGAGAKVKNKLCRAMTIPALKTGVPVLIINWVYDGPSMHPQKIKDQPGGKGSAFVGSINVQCTKTNVKAESKDDPNYYEASTVTMFTVKNREVTPYLTTKVHVSFTEGFNLYPYLSLFDSAVELGFIKKESTQFYSVPSWSENPEKKWRKKQLIGGEDADAIWANFIEEYDKKAGEKIQYSKVTEEAIKDLGFTDEQASELLHAQKEDEEAEGA